VARRAPNRVGDGEVVVRAIGAVDRLADHVEQEEPVLLQLADHAHALDDGRRVPGLRATRLARRRDQALAQVNLSVASGTPVLRTTSRS